MKHRRKEVIVLISCLTTLLSSAQLRVPENVPVSFCGKVVDQKGQPVAGAKVTFDFIVSHMMENRTETTPMATETDKNGGFMLIGITGYGIDKVSIKKEGYELSQKAETSFTFGTKVDYKLNLDNPAIFRMWKSTGKDSLISQSWHGKVACDGTLSRFDLSSGSPGGDGELEITCTRDPLDFERTSDHPFTYKLEISIHNGGIQPTEDEFTYMAPEEGYSPSLAIGRKPDDPKWSGGLTQEFYIRTSKGQYGWLRVYWDAGHRPAPTPLKWECTINPSGSRNLER